MTSETSDVHIFRAVYCRAQKNTGSAGLARVCCGGLIVPYGRSTEKPVLKTPDFPLRQQELTLFQRVAAEAP